MRRSMIYILISVTILILGVFIYLTFGPQKEEEYREHSLNIPYPTGAIAESYYLKNNRIIIFQRGNKIFEYDIHNDNISKILDFDVEELGQIQFKVRLGIDRFCICYNFEIRSPEEKATILKVFDYEGKLIDKKSTNFTISPLDCTGQLVMETALPILKYKLFTWNKDDPIEVEEDNPQIGKSNEGKTISIGLQNIEEIVPNIQDFAEVIGNDKVMILKDFRGELWILNLDDLGR